MAEQSPNRLQDAAPAFDDFEAKRARAGVAAALFGGPAERDERPSVGRYEIESRLGAGGMGVVYRAHDPDLDRPVAVKLLHNDASTDDKARARMMREARSLAKLSHPNVITVYDVGTEDGQVFVAMELVAGADLRRWLERNPRSGWREVLDLFIAAGRGLEAAHDVALVHRDFKPENVLVGDDGRVRVLDFGLARIGRRVDAATFEDQPAGATDGGTAGLAGAGGLAGALTQATIDLALMHTAAPVGSLTETGAIMGTPLYMAPELYAGQSADVRSDQFAFCASLYEGLFRQLPFGSRDLHAHVRAVTAGAVADPPNDTSVPARVGALVRQGLAPDPHDRHTDMGQLLAALELAGKEPPATALPEATGGGRWIAVAAAVILAVVVLVALELRGDGPAEPTAVAPRAEPELSAPVTDPSEVRDPTDPNPSAVDVAADSAADSATLGVALVSESGADSSQTGTETGGPAEAGDETELGPDPALRDWCHLHEDRYTLLVRSRSRRSSFEHAGACYSCRVERRRSRTRNFSPRDCVGYALCGEASPEVCQ